ncbi:SAM-dependent methyltransferase [Cryptosporangium arvum]|uniref:SAM-dependent methyltransferase n=1 Tax=Cryptosporangium arvum TaxID=80871 RepID=UPI0004B689E4|nr:SAM-dependent methyltransferase [Cryptosporangium arvum]
MTDSVPSTEVSSARRYNYWLGGTDNYPVDRESGDAIAARFPSVPLAARENRKFLGRAVRHLSGLGVRQFLDIGTGIPSAGTVHEIAPGARVVYADHDPLVLAHARKLLSGSTAYLHGDLREPEPILAGARGTLDFTQPIGLLLIAILHFAKDHDQPHTHVSTLVEALPPGSYLAVTNATLDFAAPDDAADARRMLGHEMEWRSAAELGRFFDGLDLVEPGIVPVSDWHADESDRPDPAEVSSYGAVGRKP